MRIVLAKRTSRRGEGLGNEILPWAKGWIASQVLDAHLVGPSWGMNARHYRRNFQTAQLDFVLEDTLLRLPHVSFTEEDFRVTGETDFGAAIAHWARACGLTQRRSFIVSVEGMWGGYGAIRNARAFLMAKLLSSRDALRNVYRVASKLDRNKLFVAVHMRSGDGFATPAPGESQRGRFNLQIPGDWYSWVCEELRERFGDRIQFWFFTDRSSPEFEEAVRRFNPAQLIQTGLTECSDLLLMAQADLRVCSVSSYSLAASFLSNGLYLWYEPQLRLSKGLYSLWGGEAAQTSASLGAGRSDEFVASLSSPYLDRRHLPVAFPGSALDVGDPVPDHLLEALEERLRAKDCRTNLIEDGCLPEALLYSMSQRLEPVPWPVARGSIR